MIRDSSVVQKQFIKRVKLMPRSVKERHILKLVVAVRTDREPFTGNAVDSVAQLNPPTIAEQLAKPHEETLNKTIELRFFQLTFRMTFYHAGMPRKGPCSHGFRQFRPRRCSFCSFKIVFTFARKINSRGTRTKCHMKCI